MLLMAQAALSLSLTDTAHVYAGVDAADSTTCLSLCPPSQTGATNMSLCNQPKNSFTKALWVKGVEDYPHCVLEKS